MENVLFISVKIKLLSKSIVAYFFSMQVNGDSLVTHILQNILFCVQQKKEIHTGVEQLESE